MNSAEPIAVSTLVNLEQTGRLARASLDVLRASAFVHHENIPIELVRAGGLLPCPSAVVSLNAADGAGCVLCPLVRLALVRVDQQASTFSLHETTQEAVRLGLKGPVRRHWLNRAMFALDRLFPVIEMPHWTQCERLLPHVLRVLAAARPWFADSAEGRRLFNKAGFYLVERGRHTEARKLGYGELHDCMAFNC